ncbi:MAG: hypothetical protein QM786_17670 [Breznakibacter sp.]
MLSIVSFVYGMPQEQTQPYNFTKLTVFAQLPNFGLIFCNFGVKIACNMLFRNILLAVGVSCMIVGFSGCVKQEDPLPDVSFSGSIYLNDPAYAASSFIVKYDSNHNRLGVNGVVVYRISPDRFYVFDLMCPQDVSAGCYVSLRTSETCQCSCCESVFIIASSHGNVLEGSSKWGLKPYESQVTGDYLVIWN